MQRFAGITRAAALVIDGILHGFYASSASINEQELNDSVRKQLPYYSVPERWLRVDDIPLNSNGKVDKTQLKTLAAACNTPISEVKRMKPMHTRVDSAMDALVLPEKVAIPQEPMRRLSDVDLEKTSALKSLAHCSLVEKDPSLNVPTRAEGLRGDGLAAASWSHRIPLVPISNRLRQHWCCVLAAI